jgi:hypothetical protein
MWPKRVISSIRGNAIAYLALFVALGGTSYAAVRLPARSVGTEQLRNGAVTDAKVRRGSLTASDFRPGVLPKPGGTATPPAQTSAQLRTRVVSGTVPAAGACAQGVSSCGFAGPTVWKAACNSGEQVVGGGSSIASSLSNEGVVATASRPYNPTSPPPTAPAIANLTGGTGDQGWTVSFDGPANVDYAGSLVYAVCAQTS